MFEVEDIREWLGHDVVDPGRRKIGALESIYVDTGNDQPLFGTVTIGVPTRRRLVFVPLIGSTVGPGYLRVRHDRKAVKSAPSIDVDGQLLAEAEEAVFAHYDLPYENRAGGERRLARR